MRIEELYLEGFGRFHQQTIGPVSGPVTVFCGPNEAGKSTTLAFIRAILFGFPHRFNGHYPPLAGGRHHGGQITLRDDAGALYLVQRHAGARGGRLTINTSNGQAPSPDALLRRLTGNATPDLFRNVFAFSLDELQAAASLNDSSGAIYNAGQGAPRLPDISKSLADRKGGIYLNRGNNQEVPRLVNALKDIDSQLRGIEGNAARYGSLTARRAGIDQELQGADTELSRLNSQRADADRLLNGWDDWLAMSDCESQLRNIPDYAGFPENPVARLEGFENQIKQLREYRNEASGKLLLAEEEANVAIPDEDLLPERESIDAIRQRRSRFDDAIRNLPERRIELGVREDEFARRLADLGHGWGETELVEFDTSQVVRSQIDTWKGRLAKVDEGVREAQSLLAQENRSLLERQAEAKDERENLPPEPPLNAKGLLERQDALREARSRLGEYERLRQNHETLRGQLNTLSASQAAPRTAPKPNLALVILLGMAGAALIAAGLIGYGGSSLLGIIGGLILLASAFALWLTGRSGASDTPSPVAAALEQQTAEAAADMETARRSLLSAGAALSLDGHPDSAMLDSAEARQDAVRDALGAWNTANARIENAVRQDSAQRKRLEAAEKDAAAAEESARDAWQEWRQWLKQRGLDETLTPDAMSEFLARVETAISVLSETRHLRSQVRGIENDIQEFRGLVEPVAQRCGQTLRDGDPRHLSIIAENLIGRLDQAQTAFSDRQRARERAEENRQSLEGREQSLLTAEKELAALLAAGGAEDAEEFRRRARQRDERVEMERRRDEHRRALERLSGPGERFHAFQKNLAMADPHQLSEESARLAERLEELSARRDALREERGGIDTELAQLTSEEESSALRIRRHTLEEQLREHAREWSKLTIAEDLLKRTRQKFERERQPGVIRHAQEFFSEITGQRYQRLYAPIGEQTVTVTDTTGTNKQPSELSRGTREQLYLALRFGLICEFGEHAERLPVVVDEALVNFDPERARLAAESFARLAKTNQVLVFTCHPSTAEMFAEAAGAQVLDISR